MSKEIKVNSEKLDSDLKHKLSNLNKREWITFTWNYISIHAHKQEENEEKKDDKEKDIFTIPHVHEYSAKVKIMQGPDWGTVDPSALVIMCKNRFGDYKNELANKSIVDQANYIRIELQKLLKSSVPIEVEINDNLGTGAISSSDCEAKAAITILEVISGQILELREKVEVINKWIDSAAYGLNEVQNAD